MKLNNKGWGLQAMLVIILILMLALVVIAVIYEQTFGSLSTNSLESEVIVALEKYQKKYHSNLTEGKVQRINIDELIDNEMLNEIYYNNTKCKGYGTFVKKNNKINYNAYLKCGDKYITDSYGQ